MRSRNRILLFGLILTFVIITGCSSSNTSQNKTNEVMGTIMVVGNEPFTKLAIQFKPDSAYILKCDSTLRNKLIKNQGRVVKVYYNKIESTNDGEKISVVKAELK